ncbi:ethionine resistance protein [Massospora cicadina]|nr:ethionine resistance protein [Massospora cicadina]
MSWPPQSVVLSLANVSFSIAIGQSISASNRIGNLIGAGMAKRARLASRCALLLALILPLISVVTLLNILPVVAAYQIFDSVGSVSAGILRGQGRQKIGAIANFLAFYVLAIPLALYAVFRLGYGVRGLWLGTCLALGITSTTVASFVLRSDWGAQVAACRRRLSAIESSGPSYP